MAEYDREPVRPVEPRNGGSGGVIAILVVIVVLLVAGFLYFTQYGGDVDQEPDIELNVPEPTVPDVGNGGGDIDIQPRDGGGR